MREKIIAPNLYSYQKNFAMLNLWFPFRGSGVFTMFRKLLFVLLLTTLFSPVIAQHSNRLRISLITCGPGDEEVWEVFGHTGIRVVDSDAHTDRVYNYGTFDFGPDFELQFMRGKLLYCVAIEDFNGFMQVYVEAGRSVEEQVLLLDTLQREHFYEYLQWNAEPENKYYKYDQFFDNCATRIRDIFPKPQVFGKAFQFGRAIQPEVRLSFRDIINSYFYRDHWTRLGVNILLGSRIDQIMSNTDIMFLPDYLREGIKSATVNGRRISTDPKLILPGSKMGPAGINGPFWVMMFVALLTIAGLSVKKLRILGRIMSTLLLFVTGLLGCLIICMWFGTDHQGCADNYNLLWCLPTNLIIAFFKPKGRGRYAIICILLLLLSLALHIFKVQCLTLLELSPVFLSLLFIYGSIYRNSKIKTSLSNA